MITPRPIFRLGSLAALLSVQATAHAQTDQTWNPAGPDDNWNKTSLNWDGAGIWTDNNNAIFAGAADTINVAEPIIFNNLTFNSTGYTISNAGAGSLILGNDLGSIISVTDAAHTATINETIANSAGGASSLTKTGNGTLVLFGSANNTYSGGTLISAGTLTASHEGALGTGPVTNNAILNLNKAAVTFTGLANSLSGNGTTNVTALGTGSGTVILNGNYANYTGTWNIGVGAAAGAGKIQFNGPDNAAATINVLSNATVYSSIGSHNAAIVLNGGDTGESLGQLRVETNAVWAGPITLAGNVSGAGDSIIGTNSGNGTFSGLIGESGGSRLLSKGGNGTSILTNANTYSGGTSILTGGVSVSSINNTGTAGNLGTGSVISFGGGGNGGSTNASLTYTGTGETTNRVLNLSTIGGATLSQNGPSGLLKFTSDLTTSGAGGKTLTLTGSTAGSGEISGTIGNIFDNGSSLATTSPAAFLAGANTLTVASVSGITIGSAVSGTGIAAGTRVIGISGTTVTLSAVTSGAGTAAQAITFTAPNAVVKNGSGTWTLSGNNSFTGNVLVNAGALKITNSNALGAGNKTVTIFPTSNPSSNSSLQLDGSAGNITLGSNLSFTTSYDALQAGTQLPIPGAAAIINLAGDNTIAGNFTFTAGGGGTAFLVNSGTLTLSGNIATNGGTRPAFLRGDGNGFITGNISNGTGTTPVGGITKDTGTGTWTISGTNTYTGNTIVNTGTLKLDYSTNNTSKLADTGGALVMGGGTVELSGGSHEEIVTSTTLGGAASSITRSSGTSTIRLNAVTPGSGSLSFSTGGLASTDNLNTNGILPWARIGNVWGTNSTNALDGPITAYSAFTDVTRLGPVSIADAISSNVRIVNGGTSGNITLAAGTTRINSLLMDASDGSATIDTTGGTLMLGDEGGGTLWQTATSGGLTIGTAPNSGTLTSGNTANTTAAPITLLNESTTNPLVINASITNNGTDPISILKGGAGEVRIAGNITSTGNISVGSGTLHLSGNNTFGSQLLPVNAGTTIILSGNNSGRAAASNDRTLVAAGTILQLQANAGNTTAGLSSALSAERTTLAPLNLSNGGTLQLRGDQSVTFTGGNAMGGWNNSTQNIDVNRLTAAGSNNVLAIATDTIPFGNTVNLNVTGGNGYVLRLGTIQNVVSANASLNLNPTTASLILAGFSHNLGATNTLTAALNLGGTAAGNAVTGLIANNAANFATGALSVTKNGTSTWDLQGVNTYTGTTTVNAGTLKLSGNRTVASGAITVGNPASASALLEVSNGTFATGTFTVGNGDNTTAGTVNQTGGTLTFISGSNQLLLGNNGTGFTAGSNSTGTYNLSGGTLTTVTSTLGVVIGVNHGTTGVFNLSGTGALVMPATGTLQITRSDNSAAGNATGTFNQTAGTATIGILQMGGSSNGNGLANAGNKATLNLSGGTFSAVTFNQLSGANDSTSAINISGTADVTLPAFPTVRGLNATATLSLNGGLLRPAAASTAWLGGLTSATIKAGGANLEVPTGRDITISQNLLADPVSTGGGLTKTGNGTLTLTGANTWTGTTTVSAGKLLVNNTSGSGTGSGSLTVASGATLGGSGTLGGGGTLLVQGTLAPGNSPGILTSDKPVNFDLGSTFLVEANSATAGTGYDVLNANSTLSIATSSVFQMTLGYAPAPGDAFTFINLASGSISGFFSNLPEGGTYTANFSGTDYDFTASYAGGSGNDLVVTAVPEPTTPLLLGLLTGFATLFRRRRAA